MVKTIGYYLISILLRLAQHEGFSLIEPKLRGGGGPGAGVGTSPHGVRMGGF
jgi:hypothetical protein